MALLRDWISRVSGFANRNKYRILIGSALVGGVWYYYGQTIRDGYELYKLMQELNSSQEPDSDSDSSKSTIKKEKNCASEIAFSQTIATSDETCQKQFHAVRVQLGYLYSQDLERIQSELRSSNEINAKEKLFTKFNQQVFSRLLTCIVSSVLLLLLARVKVCLIGRANRQPVEEEAKADHRELLSNLRHATSQEVLSRIDEISRNVVFEKFTLLPTYSVNRLDLFTVTVQDVANEIISALQGYTWLMGKLENNANNNTQSNICKETLDVLDSPQFDSVVRFLTKQFVAESIAHSVPSETSFPLAALLPGIKIEPDIITAVNGSYMQRFQNDMAVIELCRQVYFAESHADPEDVELLNNMSSDDQGMAKLGELLEKLVKADMAK